MHLISAKGYIIYFVRCDIEEIKTRILTKFKQDKQVQISQYVSSSINAYFKSSHLSMGNKKEEIEENFQNFILSQV